MAEATKDVHDAMVHLLAMQDAAWAAGDAVAFGESALPDIVFTNVVGLFSVGVERFIAQHAHIFSTIYKESRLEQRLVKITMATADVAIVDSLTTVRGFHRLPPGSTATNTGPVSYTVNYTGAQSVSPTAANITLNRTGTSTGTVSISSPTTNTRA